MLLLRPLDVGVRLGRRRGYARGGWAGGPCAIRLNSGRGLALPGAPAVQTLNHGRPILPGARTGQKNC
eukprot:8687690-Lingulodinium_polyedra.AAC.1